MKANKEHKFTTRVGWGVNPGCEAWRIADDKDRERFETMLADVFVRVTLLADMLLVATDKPQGAFEHLLVLLDGYGQGFQESMTNFLAAYACVTGEDAGHLSTRLMKKGLRDE